jgi:isoleucyl-tRNA synthetase
MIPVLNEKFSAQVQTVEDLILSEVNIKSIEYLSEDADVLVKKIKPNFKALGPKYGKQMKMLASLIQEMTQPQIKEIETQGQINLVIEGQTMLITLEDVEILTEDIPGWSVSTEGKVTVALDITISDELHNEGLAREFVNRAQNLRKELGFEVTDRIVLKVLSNTDTDKAFSAFEEYICSETLSKLIFSNDGLVENMTEVELVEGIFTHFVIEKE